MHNEEMNKVQLQLEQSNNEYEHLKKVTESLCRRVEAANASGAKISLEDIPNGVISSFLCVCMCVFVFVCVCAYCCVS